MNPDSHFFNAWIGEKVSHLLGGIIEFQPEDEGLLAGSELEKGRSIALTFSEGRLRLRIKSNDLFL